MESAFKCEAQDCSQQASYVYRGTTIYICEEHFQPSQKDHFVKIGNVNGAQEALDVVKKCEDPSLQEESIMLVNDIQRRVTETSKELDSCIDNNQLERYESIEQQIFTIISTIRNSHHFREFCVKHYLSLVCDFLSIDRKKIERFIRKGREQTSYDIQSIQAKDELEKVEAKFTEFNEGTISSIKFSTKTDLKNIYKLITGKSLTLKKIDLRLGLKCAEDVEFIRKIRGHIIPNIPKLVIKNAHIDIRLVKEFLYSFFPAKVGRFHFNHQGEMINYDEFADIILDINPKISEGLFLYKFDLGQFQLESFFKLSTRVLNVGLCFCKLELDLVPNFQYSLKYSKVQTINLDECGLPEFCDWQNHPKDLNLIEGLSCIKNLRKNPIEIYLNKCGMSHSQVRETLDKFGLDSMKILNHSM
ncbi:unnamed protein product [Moneuplotes crassus]|uniref:Uncharacterized protein n=1 Tax=Euplotes crassus TaxID=5936 RepID=A0AAD1X9I7_EUPCR|nr:unnamed protein product [Moneuplotes crassus]